MSSTKTIKMPSFRKKKIGSFKGKKLRAANSSKQSLKLSSLKAKNKAKKVKCNVTPTLVPTMDPSAETTALIAPSDYEHIYNAQTIKKDQLKVKAKQSKFKIKETVDDMPTCLVGPEDYQNLYEAKYDPKRVRSKKVNNPIPDDAPTVLKMLIEKEATMPKNNNNNAYQINNNGQTNNAQRCCSSCLLM